MLDLKSTSVYNNAKKTHNVCQVKKKKFEQFIQMKTTKHAKSILEEHRLVTISNHADLTESTT
jgi:uncharacterized protein (DUF1778 family)